MRGEKQRRLRTKSYIELGCRQVAFSLLRIVSKRMARSARNPTIAVIDDDAVFRALAKLHLANVGYEVLMAEDAIEGGHLIIRTPPDLIICDVNMPYMSGYEFIAAVKADPLTQHIPVVFATVEHDVADHASQLGAVAYLRKPVTADRLLEVVGLFASRTTIAIGGREDAVASP